MVRACDIPSAVGQFGDVSCTQTSGAYLCQLTVRDSKTNFTVNSRMENGKSMLKTPTSIFFDFG